MASTALSSPLLALPGELRNKIWEEVFRGNSRRLFMPVGFSYNGNVGLILTCKQTYLETIPLFYKATRFYFIHPDTCMEWLFALSNGTSAIYIPTIPRIYFDTAILVGPSISKSTVFSRARRAVLDLLAALENIGVGVEEGVVIFSLLKIDDRGSWTGVLGLTGREAARAGLFK